MSRFASSPNPPRFSITSPARLPVGSFLAILLLSSAPVLRGVEAQFVAGTRKIIELAAGRQIVGELDVPESEEIPAFSSPLEGKGVEVDNLGDGIAKLFIDPAQFEEFTYNAIEQLGVLQVPIEVEIDGVKSSCLAAVTIDLSKIELSNSVDEQPASASDRDLLRVVSNELDGGSDTAGSASDPISTATREFFYYQEHLDLEGPTLPLSFDLFHGSQLAGNAIFGHLPRDFASSHHLLARKLELFEGGFFQLQFHLGLGQMVTFERAGGEADWRLAEGERWTFMVEETAGYYYLKDPARQRVYLFKKHPLGPGFEPAYCLQIEDRNGNTLSYSQPPDPTVEGPVSVTDGLGRTLNFTYEPVAGAVLDLRKYLTRVEDQSGRGITLDYEEVAGRVRLASLTDPMDGVTEYSYDAQHFMTARILPAGNAPYNQSYEGIPDFFGEGILGAVTSQTDTFGQRWAFEEGAGVPALGDKEVIVTNPDGSKRRHYHSEGNILSAIVDETGEVMAFSGNDARDHFVEVIDRDGGKTGLAYLDSGHLASRTDSRGTTTRYSYTESAPQTFENPEAAESVQFTFLDPTEVAYGDSSTMELEYDARGNVTRYTNRAGEQSVIVPNERGQPQSVTNGEEGVMSFSYEASGVLATFTDSDLGVFRFEYDGLFRVVRVEDPEGTDREFSYDALDRLVTSTDEQGVVRRFTYDPNSNLTSIVRGEGLPEEQELRLEYDALDRLVKVVDPTEEETSYDYPYFARPVMTTFPDGTTHRFAHDARRALISFTDEGGATSEIGYTASELVESFTSAEGRATQFGRDPNGALTSVTDPSGDRYSAKLDVFSRFLSTVDGVGRVRTMERDGEGRVTARTDPGLGTTRFEHDLNGFLVKLTDPRGGDWTFERSTMGRVNCLIDPDDRKERRTYDSRGRLQTVTHPDGVVETFSYNPDSTVASRVFSDGLALSYTYDGLNRILTGTRELGGTTDTVSYEYEQRSNPVATTVNGLRCTATFDERNRLQTVTYPGGVVVTYDYDARGQVRRVSDSLTGASVEYEYEGDMLRTKATRSNGRVTRYRHDEEGLIESVEHDSGGALQYTFNGATEPVRIDGSGFPTEALPDSAAGTQSLIFNASSDLTSAGFAFDARGRRTADPGRGEYRWDSDDRLISVTAGGSTVSYSYDSLGRMTTRREGASTTNYLYCAAIRSQPIIGERENGEFKRFYVALPDGTIAYSIEEPEGAAVERFYHFGRVGNTRFLTDENGAVSDSYAYDAFGKSLGRSGNSDQIYTFVGKFGVRDEPAAELSHMRHRFYDPGTRRFVSRDPIFEALLSENANPFHYVGASPLALIDPSGLRRVGATLKGVLTFENSNDLNAAELQDFLDDYFAGDFFEEASEVVDKAFVGDLLFVGLAVKHALVEAEFERGRNVDALKAAIEKLSPIDRRLLEAAMKGDKKAVENIAIPEDSFFAGVGRGLFREEILNEVLTPRQIKGFRLRSAISSETTAGTPVGPLLPLMLLVVRWVQNRKRKT